MMNAATGDLLGEFSQELVVYVYTAFPLKKEKNKNRWVK